jgi:U3 small nucleolar RNA-associated protein 18
MYQIVATGRRPHYYVYDLHAGEVTKVPRMTGITEKSLELFETSPCGRFIAFGGKSGKVYIVSST